MTDTTTRWSKEKIWEWVFAEEDNDTESEAAQIINQLLSDNAAMKEQNALIADELKKAIKANVEVANINIEYADEIAELKAELEQVKAERDEAVSLQEMMRRNEESLSLRWGATCEAYQEFCQKNKVGLGGQDIFKTVLDLAKIYMSDKDSYSWPTYNDTLGCIMSRPREALTANAQACPSNNAESEKQPDLSLKNDNQNTQARPDEDA